MSKVHLAHPPGSFEHIEAAIRRNGEGNALGHDFEWLCKWFLLNAPRYRGMFDRVWLWKEWPDRWGGDAGIDIVARTRDGQLWAIQAKAHHPDRSIPKRELDSFLSESSRPQFAYRLLIASTNDIGRNAQRTLDGQEKPVGFVSRGDLLSEEVWWPAQIGDAPDALPKRTPLPHQQTAIDRVLRGFRRHDRGQLIMACGTGKTLTAMWIAERLKSRRTLVLVPSLSLVSQNLREWGRSATRDFDFLVVCGDESVAERNHDAPVHSPQELGVPVTTDPASIRRFLNRQRSRAAVVFATYHSANRIAAAQKRKPSPFDLVICDEAHRCVGASGRLFTTALDGKKIKARKRLFMTATPRYISDRVRKRAEELEYELVSMDDSEVFGPEFHALTFHEAITADPPLLTDYQVVVIGVTDREVRKLAEDARLVRTTDGVQTDARTLAAQIGLAKAIRQYDLTKIITFHARVSKAEQFIDADRSDSLPALVGRLPRDSRPSGAIWSRHISGDTPAGRRTSLLKEFGGLPSGTRGIISNCACLGEGVDVPVLDGVAFIDPKGSMVDIIQAVGRVIRKSPHKKIGTVIVPVIIDESEDADRALSRSAFQPVWQVLKALRAHDRRLADELDSLRLHLSRNQGTSQRIALPDRIRLDLPQLLLKDFAEAFYVRTVETTTSKPPLTIEQILAWADEHKAAKGDWPNVASEHMTNTDETWSGINSALRVGNRGLRGGSSLALLLDEHRDVRNIQNLPSLTIKQILAWANAHHAATGKWPNVTSGQVTDTQETWTAINHSLRIGNRGLPGGSSLATLLDEFGYKRSRQYCRPLTVQQILTWADAHHAATGKWPNKESGRVAGMDETWIGINDALIRCNRGLKGGSSLAMLLHKHRNKRHLQNLPSLTIPQILIWVDSYHAVTGAWPNIEAGQIACTDETWSGVNVALKKGRRSLPGGSSLAMLLYMHRDVRNVQDLPRLELKEILAWANAHFAATGSWPNKNSGQVASTNETWSGINAAMRKGGRGLSGGSSLATLLEDHGCKRNRNNRPPLTIDQILAWASAHRDTIGGWPNSKSGRVIGTDETWSGIDTALMRGNRGLLGGLSLAVLLDNCGYKTSRINRPRLAIKDILALAQAHERRTGSWPNLNSGQVTGTEEKWNNIDAALVKGNRGLQGGSSLAMLLDEHGYKRSRNNRLPLTIEQILAWADAHHVATSKWPNKESGQVVGTDETWAGINAALRKGGRGIAGGSSLAILLDEERKSDKV